VLASIAMKPNPPNARWFKSLFEQRGFSQRKLAKDLKMDPAALTLVLQGRRKLKSEEAAKMASHLSVSVEEILEHAGIEIATPSTHRKIKIEGYFDGELKLHRGEPRGAKLAPCPFQDPTMRAARIQSAGSRFESIDGALVYYQESSKFDPEALGRLALVTISRDPTPRLRVIRRGYQPGTYNLTALNGEILEESVKIDSSSPVVWMKL
jgi:transcriptional regulator with XRE-family HTH domain